jgi:hypothetical protein
MKPGDKLRSSRGDLCHVVAVIEDKGYTVVVYRRWWRRRKRWDYACEFEWIIREFWKCE